jgi:hypothetical protein
LNLKIEKITKEKDYYKKQVQDQIEENNLMRGDIETLKHENTRYIDEMVYRL